MTSTQRWTCALPDWVSRRPLVIGGRLIVRAEGHLVAVDAASGEIAWSTQIDPNNARAEFLIASGTTLITDRDADGRTVLVATNLDGEVVWEVHSGVTILDGFTASDTQFVAVGESETESIFLRIDSRSGEVLTRQPVPWIPDRLAMSNGRLVAAKRDELGLVLLDNAGLVTQHFGSDPVYGLAVNADHFVLSTRVDEEPRLRRLSGQFELAWEQPLATIHLACDESAIACVSRSDPQAVDLLASADGSLIWQSPSFGDEPVQLAVYDHIVEARALTKLAVLDRRDGSLLGEHVVGTSAVDLGNGGYVVAAMDTLTCYENPEH